MSASIEDLIRKIVREEIKLALAVKADTQPATLEICGVWDRTDRVCQKPKGHGQRHRYSIPAKTPSTGMHNSWEKVTSVKPGRFTIAVGNPVRVTGERGLWKVIGIECHHSLGERSGKVNVEVIQDRTGHSRIFPLSRIVYKRPKKES